MGLWTRLAWTILGVMVGASLGMVAAIAVLMVLGAVGFFDDPNDMPLYRLWEWVAVWWGGLLLGASAGGWFAWRRTATRLQLGAHRGSRILNAFPVLIAAGAIAWALSMPGWDCVSGSDNTVCTDQEFFRWAVGSSGTLVAILAAFTVGIFRRRRRVPPSGAVIPG